MRVMRSCIRAAHIVAKLAESAAALRRRAIVKMRVL